MTDDLRADPNTDPAAKGASRGTRWRPHWIRLRFALRLALTVATFALIVMLLGGGLGREVPAWTLFAVPGTVVAWIVLCFGPPSPRIQHTWSAIIPVLGLAGITVGVTDLPFQTAWRFAESDFEPAVPAIVASGGKSAPDSIGALQVGRVHISDDRVYFVIRSDGVSDSGMAYLPNVRPIPADNIGDGRLSLDPYDGPWWKFSIYQGGM